MALIPRFSLRLSRFFFRSRLLGVTGFLPIKKHRQAGVFQGCFPDQCCVLQMAPEASGAGLLGFRLADI